MIDTIQIPGPRDGGPLHALVGRSVSVRNHYEKSGLAHSSDIYGDGGVPGAGRYLEGVIVAVTSGKWKTVRVGYPARYFGGMPRYATIPMQNLRSPQQSESLAQLQVATPDGAETDAGPSSRCRENGPDAVG